MTTTIIISGLNTEPVFLLPPALPPAAGLPGLPADSAIPPWRDSQGLGFTLARPETGLDVMSMKLVRDLQVGENGRVNLTFRPSSVICPLGFQLGIDIKEAVQRVEGVNGVDVVVDGFIRADRLMNILKQMD